MHEPSTSPDIASEIDSLEEELMDIHREKGWAGVVEFCKEISHSGESIKESDHLQKVIAKLLYPSNIWVNVIGLMFAAGLNRGNCFSSQRAAARAMGLTPAAVNASVNEWREYLGTPRNEHSKSQAAVESYRINGINNHWRKQCTPKNLQ